MIALLPVCHHFELPKFVSPTVYTTVRRINVLRKLMHEHFLANCLSADITVTSSRTCASYVTQTHQLKVFDMNMCPSVSVRLGSNFKQHGHSRQNEVSNVQYKYSGQNEKCLYSCKCVQGYSQTK